MESTTGDGGFIVMTITFKAVFDIAILILVAALGTWLGFATCKWVLRMVGIEMPRIPRTLALLLFSLIVILFVLRQVL